MTNNTDSELFRILIFVRRYPIPVFAGIGLLIGSITHWIIDNPEIGHWIWFVTLLIGGTPIVYGTIRGMTRRHFASDIVATLAIIVSIVMNDAFPGLIIVLMQSGGSALEDHAFRKASFSLDALLARSPRIANLQKDGDLKQIKVEDVKIDDVLLVRSGDLIPVDGMILEGTAEIDESALTGEPLPKIKTSGNIVFSGAVNVGDAFKFKCTKTSADSQYSKIVQLVRKAQQEKAPIQRLADKYAVWFTPIVIIISVLGWFITKNPETVLAVLVVATPCPLIFATPTAIISGISRAAKRGIIVKTGAAIEQVGKSKVAVFDKTGTITLGTPTIDEIITLNGTDRDILLRMVASVEQMSSHPAAIALVQMGKDKFGKLPTTKSSHEIGGSGVEGFIDGTRIIIGSQSVFEQMRDVGLTRQILEAKKDLKMDGKMFAYVTIGEKLAGVIVFGDKIRPESNQMIQRLGTLGIKHTVMLTGDNFENAEPIAKQAGITNLEANLLPEQKVIAVKKLKEEYGQVVMIGDGINDAPALAMATTGIAMGAHGTAISAEAADVVFLVDDVAKTSEIVEISQRTLQIAKQGIFIGLGASFVLMAIASVGLIPPAIGALLQEILDVSVILNALRAR